MREIESYSKTDLELIAEAMDSFDFHTVERVMEFTGWHWATIEGDTPKVRDLRRVAHYLLSEVVEGLNRGNPEFMIATGGFEANGYNINDNKQLNLRFVLEAATVGEIL